MSSSEEKPIEQHILQFILHRDFYSGVKHILSEDMFEGLSKTVFRTILNCHDVATTNLTAGEVHSMLLTSNPALTKSSREDLADIFNRMRDPSEEQNVDLHRKIVEDFWARDQARIIGERAIDIYTGDSTDFAPIKSILDRVSEHSIKGSETYTIVEEDFLELIEREEEGVDFPFDLNIIKDNLPGMSRGNLGIIFARPETGKTTFCAHLCASYIKNKHKVVYWANEDKASKIKLRIIQSYYKATKQEMIDDKTIIHEKYIKEIKPYFTLVDSVGTSVEELDQYCKLAEPDIVFADQLDKFRVSGDFGRSDERLKEIYIKAREIAKRNDLLFWAVSQASYEAHNRMSIDYSMMDGSRTGKAGEADVIIGIGKTGDVDADNYMRYLFVSKNKINGYHGMINANIDIHRGFYY
jgi:replicative DNA helicase